VIGLWMDEHAAQVFWGGVMVVLLVHMGGC
jgi:hypothetical protein